MAVETFTPPLPCMDEINQHNNEVHYVKKSSQIFEI